MLHRWVYLSILSIRIRVTDGSNISDLTYNSIYVELLYDKISKTVSLDAKNSNGAYDGR